MGTMIMMGAAGVAGKLPDPANDYSQIGDSEYFTDLGAAVARANEMLNMPVTGEEDVTPVVGGQAGPRMKLARHRRLARPGWRSTYGRPRQ